MDSIRNFFKFFRNTYRTYGLEQKQKVKILFTEVKENGNRVSEKIKEAMVLADKINSNGSVSMK